MRSFSCNFQIKKFLIIKIKKYYFQEFRPLCQIVRRRIELQDEEYEFRPPHYVEVICRSQNPDEHGILTNKQVTLSSTILQKPVILINFITVLTTV